MHLVFYLNIVIYATSLSQAALLTKLNSDGKFKLTDFKFNLNSLNPNEGSGGGQIRALTVDQMPTLKDTGVSIILIDIEACGVNLPNSHPRAAEIVYVTILELKSKSKSKSRLHVNIGNFCRKSCRWLY